MISFPEPQPSQAETDPHIIRNVVSSLTTVEAQQAALSELFDEDPKFFIQVEADLRTSIDLLPHEIDLVLLGIMVSRTIERRAKTRTELMRLLAPQLAEIQALPTTAR